MGKSTLAKHEVAEIPEVTEMVEASVSNRVVSQTLASVIGWHSWEGTEVLVSLWASRDRFATERT